MVLADVTQPYYGKVGGRGVAWVVGAWRGRYLLPRILPTLK